MAVLVDIDVTLHGSKEGKQILKIIVCDIHVSSGDTDGTSCPISHLRPLKFRSSSHFTIKNYDLKLIFCFKTQTTPAGVRSRRRFGGTFPQNAALSGTLESRSIFTLQYIALESLVSSLRTDWWGTRPTCRSPEFVVPYAQIQVLRPSDL